MKYFHSISLFIVFTLAPLFYAFPASSQEPDSLLFQKAEQLYDTYQYDSALVLYDILLKQSRLNTFYHVNSLLKSGNVLLTKKQFKEAKLRFDKVKKLTGEDFIDDLILSDLSLSLGHYYYFTQDYEKAIIQYMEAIRLRETAQKIDDNLAKLYNNLGLCYSYLGDISHAVDLIDHSIEIKLRQPKVDSISLAKSYNNLGVQNYSLARYDEALEKYAQAERIYSLMNYYESTSYGSTINNQGSVYLEKGDYKKALFYYTKALDIFKNLQVKNDQYYLKFNNIALTYQKLQDNEKAISYYYKVINDINNTDKYSRYLTYNGLALLYQDMKEYTKAGEYFRKAVQESSGNPYDHAYFLMNYGLFLIDIQKDTIAGMHKYFQALDIFTRNYGIRNNRTSLLFNNLAGLYHGQKRYDEACKFYQKALMAVSETFKDTTGVSNPPLEDVQDRLLLLTILKFKADLFEEMGRKLQDKKAYPTALATLEHAIKVVENLRVSYETEESRLFLSENQKETYLSLISLLDRMYRETEDDTYLAKALEYLEKGKAASLLASMRDIEAKDFAGIPNKLLKEEKDTQRELSVYKEFLYEEKRKDTPDERKLKTWENKIFALKKAHDSLILNFEAHYPKYYNLKYNTSVLPARDIQAQLDANETLIEYTLSDSVVYIYLLTREKLLLKKVAITKDFYTSLEKFHALMLDRNFSSGTHPKYKDFTHHGYQLYKTLLAPVEEHFTGRHLTIVPDEQLNYIPFDILLTDSTTSTRVDYRSLPYLLRKYTVDYSYSATLLFGKNDGKKRGLLKNLLAFAPEYDGTVEIENDILMQRQQYRDRLHPIPGAKEEVDNIMRMIGGKILEGKEATEANFKKYSGQFDLLHLAMHTILNDESPMYSKLAFSSGKDTLEDGLLNTYEIYNMKLNASMAVLSSCNSGTGKLQKGEGVMSLARGFIYAGCPSIIMSLWEVDDKAGVKLMTSFYKELRKGKSKSEALRQAKLSFLEDADQLRAHPYFWASYVPIGDPEPVYYHWALRYGLWAIMGGIILFLAVAVFAWYRNRKNSGKRKRFPFLHLN